MQIVCEFDWELDDIEVIPIDLLVSLTFNVACKCNDDLQNSIIPLVMIFLQFSSSPFVAVKNDLFKLDLFSLKLFPFFRSDI